MSFESYDWSDTVPIEQDDGPEPLAQIAYDPEYSKAMGYFRAVAQKNEHSERALTLTEKIIEHNPAHYTIWHYRQQIILSLNKDLYEELDFIQKQVEQNPKNYQLWHHRQVIVENLKDCSLELSFTEEVLNDDSKNYHAWTYRQWVIRTFNLWDNELSFVEKLIEKDIRNNSAWNQRYFAIFYNPTKPSDEFLKKEVEYGISKIKLAPNNISPWNYVKGVIAKSSMEITVLEEICKTYSQSDPISPHALGCLVDIYEDYVKRGLTDKKELGIKTCILLTEKHDTIRKKYWNYRKHVLASIA